LVAPGYAVEIVPTFSRFAEEALDLAELVSGERVLDVASGPGTLSLAAARRGTRVSAIDFSPQMIAELEARARNEGLSNIDARIADARALPFEPASFDAVFSMFALNLIPDRVKAFREIRRVVRRTGRAVVGTPAAFPRGTGFTAARDAIRLEMPSLDLDVEIPLADPEELARELTKAGFGAVQTKTSTRTIEFSSIAVMWSAGSRAAAPLVVARDAVSEEDWAQASEAILRRLEALFGAGPHALDITVNIALARP
jgi:SAM-dependent methyltransferase